MIEDCILQIVDLSSPEAGVALSLGAHGWKGACFPLLDHLMGGCGPLGSLLSAYEGAGLDMLSTRGWFTGFVLIWRLEAPIKH